MRSRRASASSSASACCDVAREAVEHEAVGAVGLRDALEDHADDDLVGHELAGRHELLGLTPEFAVLLDRAAQDVTGRDVGDLEVVDQAGSLGSLSGTRRTQEDEIELCHQGDRRVGECGRAAGLEAGHEPTDRDSLLQEAFVVAHHQLRLELLHRIEGDADDDQQRGSAEQERGTGLGDENRRERRDRRQEQRAGERQPGEDAIEELGRWPAGPHPGDEPAVLLEVVGLVDGVERDRRVEVREEDDQDRLAENVGPLAAARTSWRCCA